MFNLVSKEEYDRVVKDNEYLKDIIANSFLNLETILNIISDKVGSNNQNYQALESIVRDNNNAHRKEINDYELKIEAAKRTIEHYDSVIDSLREKLHYAETPKFLTKAGESPELTIAKEKLAKIEAEIKLVEQTPAVVRAQFLNRRANLERLNHDREQVKNEIVKLSDAPIVPQLK